MVTIRQLAAADQSRTQSALAEVLEDCVAGGASVSFLAPFSRAQGEAFYAKVFEDVARGERILLAAFAGLELVGTVQLSLQTPPNQPHRAEVAKLLVRQTARGQGVGRSLMRAVEEAARVAGRNLLVLDTVTGGAGEQLYSNLGWTRVGAIPNYALFPDGTPCDTTIFYKQL